MVQNEFLNDNHLIDFFKLFFLTEVPSGTITVWIMFKKVSIINCSMDLQEVDQIWIMISFSDTTTDWLYKENSVSSI